MSGHLPAPLTEIAWEGVHAPDVAGAVERLRREGVAPVSWSNGPNERYTAHEHPYEKLLVCAEGSITFLVGAVGTEVQLRPGEGFVLPARTRHAAIVGRGGCTCVEGHR